LSTAYGIAAQFSYTPSSELIEELRPACVERLDANSRHPDSFQLNGNSLREFNPFTRLRSQLMLMRNAQYAPDPIEVTYADWSDDPHAGTVQLWNRGLKSWVLIDEMTHPVDSFPCYIYGEVYSAAQTCAEGALETAEIVLQERLGLDAPDWITSNQSLPPSPERNVRGCALQISRRSEVIPCNEHHRSHNLSGFRVVARSLEDPWTRNWGLPLNRRILCFVGAGRYMH
jgi:hypothetical protein